jgi:hypothetical protein
MIYLNIILTILCLLLLTLLVVGFLFYRKFKSNVGKVSHLKGFDGLPDELKEPFKLKETMQLYNSLMENFIKPNNIKNTK